MYRQVIFFSDDDGIEFSGKVVHLLPRILRWRCDGYLALRQTERRALITSYPRQAHVIVAVRDYRELIIVLDRGKKIRFRYRAFMDTM